MTRPLLIDKQFAKICGWLKENNAIMRTDIKGGTTVLSKRPPSQGDSND